MNPQGNNQIQTNGDTNDQASGQIQPQSGQPTSQPASPNTTKGVLLILSPFILLTAGAVIASIRRFTGIEGPVKALINVLTLLLGIGGMIMFFVGPILGIIILTKKTK